MLRLRARAYGSNREFDRGVADYDRLLQARPNSPELLNARGLAYKDWGNSEKAMVDYDRALVFDPNYMPAINNRALIYRDRGQYDRAISEFGRILVLKPSDTLALTNRASVYEQMGDLNRAIEDYDKAIAIDPQHPRAAKLKQAAILAKTGPSPAGGAGHWHPRRARSSPSRRGRPRRWRGASRRQTPHRFGARRRRCWRRAEYDNAIAEINRSLATEPRDADALSAARHGVPSQARVCQGDRGLQPGCGAESQQRLDRVQSCACP